MRAIISAAKLFRKGIDGAAADWLPPRLLTILRMKIKSKIGEYGIIAAICLGMACWWECSHRTDRILREIEIQNRQLPKKISEMLQIDSICYNGDTNTLGYYYTVTNNTGPDLPAKDFREVQKSMAQTIRRSPRMAAFRAQKITFEYVYLSGSDKSILTKVTVTADMYK
jgi:hypothetical protein